jgi:hypothetical protein
MMIAMIEADGMMGAATAVPAAQSVDTAAVVEILAIEIYTDAEIAR